MIEGCLCFNCENDTGNFSCKADRDFGCDGKCEKCSKVTNCRYYQPKKKEGV